MPTPLKDSAPFGDRYQPLQQLGKKAGRRTFLAQDLRTEQLVVVKLLLFGDEFEWDDLKLFEREAETLQALSHPAIPRYLDHFEVETTTGKGFALVQTYIEAKSLEQQVQAGRSLSEGDLKELAIALLEILHYLHGRKPPVIHRDLKPSNILLGDRSGNSIGQVYLVDFGSVQTLAAREGGTITVVGTYGYMPPEQFGGRSVPASDLYSLGATLIYLATGQHPANLPQKDLRLDFESQVQLSLLFVRWLKQMVEPSLDRRFSTAAAALEALDFSQVADTYRTTFITQKPLGSKIKLNKTVEKIEIILPPPGWQTLNVMETPFAIAWNSFVVFWTLIALRSGFVGLVMLMVAIPFWTVGLLVLRRVFAALFCTTRVQIDSDQVALTHTSFGIEYIATPPSQRSQLDQIVMAKSAYQKSVYQWISDPDNERARNLRGTKGIMLWAGVRQYAFGQMLSEPEIKWLAKELSEWLNLPISSE